MISTRVAYRSMGEGSSSDIVDSDSYTTDKVLAHTPEVVSHLHLFWKGEASLTHCLRHYLMSPTNLL